MAINFHRQLNGLQLVPQNTITPSVLGELRYNSSTNKLELFNGIVDSIVTESSPVILTPVANNTILSNISGSSNLPSANTLTDIFDAILSSNQGDIIYRNSSAWVTLPPGTTGQVLSTNGASANPAWLTVGGGSGTVTEVDTGTGLTGGPITSTGTIALADTAVVAGAYTAANITIDAQGRITLAANGNASAPTGDPDTVAFYNEFGNLSDQLDFAWDGFHLGITQAAPKAVIHADSTTTSGTVGTGAFVFGRMHATRNVGNGAIILSSQGGGVGTSNSAVTEDSLVGGTNNSILNGPRSVIFGTSSTINCTQGNNFILGSSGQVLGTIGDEFIAGTSNIINITGGNGSSAAFGGSNSITGSVGYGFVTGEGNSVTGDHAACFGLSNFSQGYLQLVAGRYNVAQGTTGSWVNADDLFILGNGANSGSRANAFKVTKDGQAVNERIVFNPGTPQVLTTSSLISTASKTFLKVSSSGSVTVSLSDGQTDGQHAIVVNQGGSNVVIPSGLNFGGTVFTNATITLTPNSVASFIWNATTAGWHTISFHAN